jgi:hypothetical protein
LLDPLKHSIKHSGSSQDIALGVLFFLSGLTKFRPLPFLFGGREIEDDDVTSTSKFLFFSYIFPNPEWTFDLL